MLTLEIMQKMWVHADQHVAGLAEEIASTSVTVFPKYGITTPITVALMMGQFSEECGSGLEMVENLNYSSIGLLRTWPSHFTGTMAGRYAHNPRMIADGQSMAVAWGTHRRRPTTAGTIAGAACRRSPARRAIRSSPTKTGIDIVTQPDLLSDPMHTLECGVADFILCGCLPFAERGDVLNTTKHLNGGTNGLAERVALTKQWRAALGV